MGISIELFFTCLFVSRQALMALTKVCPKCHCVQHCRRSLCKKCDCMFRRTTKSTSCNKKPCKKSEDACELHKCNDRLRKAQKRKTKTILEAEARREYYRQCTAKTRASETVEQTTEYRARNKECTAKKRAREPKKESTECRACNKECTAKK